MIINLLLHCFVIKFNSKLNFNNATNINVSSEHFQGEVSLLIHQRISLSKGLNALVMNIALILVVVMQCMRSKGSCQREALRLVMERDSRIFLERV